MREENAIEVRDVVKKFRVFYDKGHTLKELALFSKRRKYEERTVLDGISFEVRKGEAIGLIGHNGCGKSTTLKLLTRIMYPDSGTIEMKGRVSSLIELGAGFHPDMSGRQNIYINASIFGLTKKEIDARIDKIIEFSELEDFIDNPVRTYSSGMYARLAFAVAINVDADILLIDEILAVGDMGFQKKCFNKLKEIKREGTTIVIVSHSLDQIENICETSYWIHKGKIKAKGKPTDVHPLYMDYISKKKQITAQANQQEKEAVQEKERDTRLGTGEVRITRVAILDEDGQERQVYKTGEKIRIKGTYKCKKKIEKASIGIEIFRSDSIQCFKTSTKTDRIEDLNLDGEGQFELEITEMMLLPGRYAVDAMIEDGDGLLVDCFRGAIEIDMYSDIRDGGIVRLKHQWNL